MLRTFAALVVGASLVLSAMPAGADEGDDDDRMSRAEAEFKKGDELFVAGRYRAAAKRFEKAYELSELPDILFNIAQCYRNLGDYKSAIDHYERYLEGKPDAENRDAVETTIADLRDKLKEDNGATFDKPKKNGDDRGGGQPFYKHWAFWAGVAVVVVAGGATGYYLATRPPGSDLGNVDFGR